MKKKFAFFLVCIMFVLIFINERNVYGKEYKWKIDDLLTSDRISEIRIAPDCKMIVWSVRKWNLKTHKTYNVLYYSELKKGAEIITLTRSKEKFYSIRWVPGKSAISFKTGKKFKETQPNNLWFLNLKGGEPYPLTKFKQGLSSYEWIDANSFVYLAAEEKTLFEMEKKKRKDTSVQVEDEEHRKIYRLFTYNLKSKKKKRLTDNKKPITNFTISPKRTRLIYRVSLSMLYGQDQKIRPAYFIYDFNKEKSREIFADRKLKPTGSFAWSPDETGIYATVSYSTHPIYTMASVNKIYYYDLKTKSASEIDLKWDRYSGWRIIPLKDGFITPLLNGVHYKYARFYKKGNGWRRRWISGDLQKNIRSLMIGKDKKSLVYSWSTASKPVRYYRGKLSGLNIITYEEIMKLNSPVFKRPMAKTEIIRWKGALNDEVEGILYYPLNYEKGKKYPLIVMIHGGPNGADMDFFSDRLAYPAHLMAERGAFSLKVNYHGSSNYGIEFGESIAGHYYEYEIPDIEKGVDFLIKKGLADPKKLGIIGWSNGAILGTALNITTERYKVASLGAGDVNWTSDYGNCAFGVAFDNYYFGGPPWEKLNHYIEKSPLFKLKKVVTPTLIFHGSLDRAVPYEQGWEYYRALKEIGKAPVRFISFPGEGHGPRKLAHRRRKLKEEIDWFDKYLFETFKEKNESVKKGSPLEMLKKYKSISKYRGFYGAEKSGKLIPETVIYKKMKIGRFEVTRAQWSAFDPKYKFSSGTGNYPVSGVNPEQIRKYCSWLSKLTGEKYRLPTKKEGEKIYSVRNGNLFDYWAGYKIGPDDYNNAVKYLQKYKPGVLLKEVGLFKPAGKELVFDLGGNVSEWVKDSNGKYKIMGGSAILTSDKSFKIADNLEYCGFRVIKE